MSLTKEAQEVRRAELILNSNVNSEQEGDLIPFFPGTINLVYGGMDYARSVFGTDKITRSVIINYFDNARLHWPNTEYAGLARYTITNWCREQGVRPLHYTAPMGVGKVWFKDEHDLFLFKLRFGL